ncbi:MAG TPA: hypothetical protein VIG51_09575 [Candidatus Baltobacteraceae bacterium]
MIVTDDDVRYALRNLHSDRLLATSCLAGHLQRAFGSQSHREAVIAALERTFHALPQSAEIAELRDIVYRNDVERTGTRAPAAAGYGTSKRSYFRKRRRAVQLIVDYINDNVRFGAAAVALFSQRPESVKLESPHPRRSRDEMFYAFRTAFESNRVLGDLFAMERDLAALNGYRHLLAEHHAAEVEIMEAELEVYLRHFSQASRIVESLISRLPSLNCSRLWLLTLLVRAQLAFAVGNVHDAERLASTVQDASRTHGDLEVSAAILRGRVAVLTGKHWHSSGVAARTQSDELSLAAVQSRHYLIAGNYDAAHDAALWIHQRSLHCGFLPLASQSAATLAGCYGAVDPTQRGAHAVRALKLLAASGSNACVARDLFQFRGWSGPSASWIEAIGDDLAAIYVSLRPRSAFCADASLRMAASLLIRAIVSRVHDAADVTSLEPLIDRLVHFTVGSGISGGALSRELPELIAFGDFLKVWVPISQQATFARTFNSAAGVVVRAVARLAGYQRLRALSIVS